MVSLVITNFTKLENVSEIQFWKKVNPCSILSIVKICESIGADRSEQSSGLELRESALILQPNDPEHYVASSNRILDVSSMFLRCYGSNEFIELNGKYILEIKTRAVGSLVYNH